MNTVGLLIQFLVLLALTAFFNLAEMALVAARPSKLAHAANTKAAQQVLALKRQPGQFFAAIRTGDLVTDLLMGACIVTGMRQAIQSVLNRFPLADASAAALASVVAFAVVSYIVLVVGDLAPKSVALSAPERVAMWIAAPVRVVMLVARPCSALLEASNSVLLRLFGVKPDGEERVTEEEIRRILSEGLSAGVLVSFERSMMERVLDLDHRSVRTVMTGRRDIQFLRADSDPTTLKAAVLGATASLLPVSHDGTLDALVGVISRADVLAAIATGQVADLVAMATPPTYVTEYASALSVLETLKHRSVHLAMVVDEFGSVLGLVTLADVLEAVAGDVTTDDGPLGMTSERPLEPEADGTYLLSGDQPVDDIVEAQLLPAPVARSYKTMAGLVTDRLRRIPVEGEIIDLPSIRIEVIGVRQGAVTELRLIPKRNPRG
jgi:putative hemolysin